MTRIAIFDDNSDRLDSLGMLVRSTEGFELCGAFHDCNNVLTDVEKTLPDIVLMDIDMPGVSGIDATRIIKQHLPNVHVIIQTVFEDQEAIFNAIRAGASGYLLKSGNAGKIMEAIHDVLAGGAPLTPSVAARVMRHFKEEYQPAVDFGLSDREKETLKLLVEGHSYKMIADELSISYNTVNSHIKRIYEKLQVHSLGEAISKTIQQRILS
jgi:two-component system nitrate/nitrite response regulator NarL